MAEKSRSPWVWVGCGCIAILGVGLAVVAALLYFGFQTAKTMSDPVALRAKALRILSADSIPDGYQAQIAMKVPLYAEVVRLEGIGDVRGEERQFMYLGGLRSDADLKAAFLDDETFDRELRQAGMEIEPEQRILSRDALRIGGAEVRYLLVEGEIQFDFDGKSGDRSVFDFNFSDLGENAGEEMGSAKRGAAVLIRCSESDRPGLGFWTGPPAASEAAEQPRLVDFLGQFGFCSE